MLGGFNGGIAGIRRQGIFWGQGVLRAIPKFVYLQVVPAPVRKASIPNVSPDGGRISGGISHPSPGVL